EFTGSRFFVAGLYPASAGNTARSKEWECRGSKTLCKKKNKPACRNYACWRRRCAGGVSFSSGGVSCWPIWGGPAISSSRSVSSSTFMPEGCTTLGNWRAPIAPSAGLLPFPRAFLLILSSPVHAGAGRGPVAGATSHGLSCNRTGKAEVGSLPPFCLFGGLRRGVGQSPRLHIAGLHIAGLHRLGGGVAQRLLLLGGPHGGIAALMRQQFGMGAALDDAALLQHDDLV